MRIQTFDLYKYEADEGMVFDWAEPRFQDVLDENGNVIDTIIEHLYAKVLYIGRHDTIDNYVEVKEPKEEE